MSKNKSKGKGKKPAQPANSLSEDTLAQLTSRIDYNLAAKDNKRKNPPTEDSPAQSSSKKQKAALGKALSKEDYETLLAEVKALGGDEQDMDLIGGVDDSEDEYDQGASEPVDKKLKAELAALSKELGFAELQPEADEEEPEADEQEDDEEGEDDDDESDESEDDREDEKIPESRKMGNMVCIVPKLATPGSDS